MAPYLKSVLSTIEFGVQPLVQVAMEARNTLVRYLPPVSPGFTGFDLVAEVVTFASRHMERRGWSASFLEERLRIARKFAPTSEYVSVWEKFADGRAGDLIGTVGLTLADPERVAEGLHLLPMEDSHGWRIDEPFKIELRTYAMDLDRDPDVFAQVFAGLATRLERLLANHPEALSRECFFTYGDATSERLYSLMGFVVDESYPAVEHEGTTWKVLKISPERFLENYRRVNKFYSVKVNSSVFAVEIPGGPAALASGAAGVTFRKGILRSLTFAAPYELKPGFEVSVGGQMSFHENRTIAVVSGLNRPIQVATGVFTQAGAGWTESGTLSFAAAITEPYRVPGTRVTADIGSSISWSPEARVRRVGKALAGSQAVSGIVIQPETEVTWERDIVTFYLSFDTEIAPGVIASAGSRVRYRIGPRGKGVPLSGERLKIPFLAPDSVRRWWAAPIGT